MNALQPFELEFNEAGDSFKVTKFQLLQWKHALSLEEKGLKLSRGRSVSSHLRKILSLKRTTPISYLREWVDGVLAHVTPCVECDHQFDDNPGNNMCRTCEDWISKG